MELTNKGEKKNFLYAVFIIISKPRTKKQFQLMISTLTTRIDFVCYGDKDGG